MMTGRERIEYRVVWAGAVLAAGDATPATALQFIEGAVRDVMASLTEAHVQEGAQRRVVVQLWRSR